MTRHLGLTFCNVMGAQINSAHDYLPLPWDDKAISKELTEEEVNQLMELMRKENEAIEKKKKEEVSYGDPECSEDPEYCEQPDDPEDRKNF